jgi:hypothetical protein
MGLSPVARYLQYRALEAAFSLLSSILAFGRDGRAQQPFTISS